MQNKSLTFNNVYAENHAKILNLINYKLGNKERELAEELTNDVFLRVDKHLCNYNSEQSSLTTWIYNIANNIVIDHWRKASLDTFSISLMTDNDGKETFDLPTNTKNPEQLMVNYEQGELVEAAINSLPAGYKRLTEMFFMEQRSHQEIVDELNLPLGTVKGQLHRAKAKLKKFLT